jgi:hypothetical protein
MLLPPVEEAKIETPGRKKLKRKRKETFQGLMRNFRKLQGLFCKA